VTLPWLNALVWREHQTAADVGEALKRFSHWPAVRSAATGADDGHPIYLRLLRCGPRAPAAEAESQSITLVEGPGDDDLEFSSRCRAVVSGIGADGHLDHRRSNLLGLHQQLCMRCGESGATRTTYPRRRMPSADRTV
jgi:hypothetical protein